MFSVLHKVLSIYFIRETRIKPSGLWTIVASANGPYSLRVTGVSKLDFGVKFATDPKTDYETANWQPVQGTEKIEASYFYISNV